MLAFLLSARLFTADPGISVRAEEILRRELLIAPEQFAPSKPFDLRLSHGTMGPMEPIGADTLATLGGLMDAASTYYFTKAKEGREGNKLIGFTNSHPEATALAALGGVIASKAVTKLIRRASPKAAEAIAANLGALQLAYGTHNWQRSRTYPSRPGRGYSHSSSVDYQMAMQRLLTREN